MRTSATIDEETPSPHSPAVAGEPLASSRGTRFAGCCLILFAAALASVPILIQGLAGGDDVEFHLISWLNVQHSWQQGILYPHWAASPNFGAGEPRFVFYPPTTWLLGAALGFVLPWSMVPAAMTFLLLAGTGLATRAFARLALAETPATLAGCTAIFSGYALFSAYYRMAFGELCGGIWIPLALLFLLRDRNPAATLWLRTLDGSTAPLAVVVAGCWLCDAPVGVMASYLLAFVALIASVRARSFFPALRAAISFVSGLALSGFYLLPAAWEQRWVDIQQATGVNGDPGLRIENNWLFPHHVDAALMRRDGELHYVSLVAVSMVAVALMSLLVLWLRAAISAKGGHTSWSRREKVPALGPSQASGWWLMLALIPAVALFLQLPASLPVWDALPKLRFLQFPWRWLLVVEAPMATLFAAAVWPGGSWKRWLRPVVASLCGVFFVTATVFAGRSFSHVDSTGDDLSPILAKQSSGTGFVGTDEYAPPGADNYFVATGLPDGCLTDNFVADLGIAATPEENPVWRPEQGSCFATATAQVRKPEHMRISIVAARAGLLILRLRSYPAWRVTVNGQLATNLPSRLDGLIAVPVPQGSVNVNADWSTTPDVFAGRWVSVLGLLLLTGIALLERALTRPRSS